MQRRRFLTNTLGRLSDRGELIVVDVSPEPFEVNRSMERNL
jgi:hypothetical protein